MVRQSSVMEKAGKTDFEALGKLSTLTFWLFYGSKLTYKVSKSFIIVLVLSTDLYLCNAKFSRLY